MGQIAGKQSPRGAVSPNSPDFRHRDGESSLWIEGRWNPDWVARELAKGDIVWQIYEPSQALCLQQVAMSFRLPGAVAGLPCGQGQMLGHFQVSGFQEGRRRRRAVARFEECPWVGAGEAQDKAVFGKCPLMGALSSHSG